MAGDHHRSQPEPLTRRSGGYLTDPRCRRDPHSLLQELREDEPVHRSATGAWIISGYDLVMDAIRDERLSRGAAGYETAATLFEPGPAVELFRGRLVNSDGETHTRRRKLVNRSFHASGRRPVATADPADRRRTHRRYGAPRVG